MRIVNIIIGEPYVPLCKPTHTHSLAIKDVFISLFNDKSKLIFRLIADHIKDIYISQLKIVKLDHNKPLLQVVMMITENILDDKNQSI